MTSRLTLVTGATGLLGNNVVRMLLDQGQAVRVLARESSDPRPLEGLDLQIARGDVRDPDSVRQACEGVECVIHSAGYVQIGRSGLDRHRAINVEGTRHVAQAARRCGVRMVHVSSCDAIGVNSVEEPADEETPLNDPPPVPYVISKREAELAVLDEVDGGLDAVIVNPGFMLGPWDWKPSSGRMLLEVAGGRALLAPRGWFSLCDARDVAAGLLAALQRGQTGRRYILAGVTYSYLDAWRLFAQVTGARSPWRRAGPLMLRAAGFVGDLGTRLTGREPNVNSGVIALAALPKNYSSDRAQTELGYQIRPPEETVRDAWTWFQRNGYAR
ncbi:MAG: SDR family oxidoreductase [Planctomycetes bacterium]|nr:SDR family oxidoreductase [Planctomycetota bacterium]